MKKSNIFIMISIILIIITAGIGSKGEVMIEDLGVVAGIGNDIEKKASTISYNISFLIYSFEGEDKITNRVLTGESKSLGETRENRQIKTARKLTLGLCRTYIFSEDASVVGLKNELDIIHNNPDVNDSALCVVCKGKAEDILKYPIKGFQSSAEYISDMVKDLQEFNFFPMQYTLMDLIVRDQAEGRNSLLPYIEIKDNNIETTGLAIFKKDKMVGKADIDESRIINMLKEKNVKGVLTLQNSSKKYINCYTTSKNTVKCSKVHGKYKFIINLNLKGNIQSNELYDNIKNDPQVMKKFEKDMTNYVQKMSNDTINKINCKYKTDVLDLGRIAAAKYGRGTGSDWDKIICSSDIKVNVKFTVDNEGRGDF